MMAQLRRFRQIRHVIFISTLLSLFPAPSTCLIHDGATIDDVLKEYDVISGLDEIGSSRQRRSWTSASSSSSSSSSSSPSRYASREEKFTALGREFHLILTPRVGILAHDFEAVRTGADGVEIPIAIDGNHIAYEGRLVGESYSHVQATYEKDGQLNAKIVTSDETYYVEPSDRHFEGQNERSLLVYRQSDVKNGAEDDGGGRAGGTDAGQTGGKDGGEKSKSCGGGILFHDDEAKQDNEKDLKNPASSASSSSSASSASPAAASSSSSSSSAPSSAPNSSSSASSAPSLASPAHSSSAHSSASSSSSGSKSKRSTRSYVPDKNTCPLLLVADYNFFKHMGKGDLVKTTAYMVGLIDRVDQIYRATKWNDVGMSGLGFEIKKIIVHETPHDANPSHYNHVKNETWYVNDLLIAFSQHKRNERFCLVHLFTHQGFAGYVLGLAYIGSARRSTVGGICTKPFQQNKRHLFLNTGLSSTINLAGRRILTREADLVTTHELGHNWGSEHDPDTQECSPSSRRGGSYIMYTYSVSGMETNNRIFSPCSRRSINAVLESKSANCFAPKSRSYCGNHKREKGEQCDAGVQGDDPCCNRKCKLTEGAECSPSNDRCCDLQCRFSPKGAVCAREDLHDSTCAGNATCPGDSGECGKPNHKPKGSPCMERGRCDDNGFCVDFCAVRGLVHCICPRAEDVCKWCCKESENATCEPYVDGESVIDPLLMREGIPCPFGYCGADGVCKKIKQDMIERFFSIIQKLDSNYVVKVMKRNIVGTILIFSALVWIPASCFISWVDRKQEDEEQKEWDWYMQEHFVPASLADCATKKVRAGAKDRGRKGIA